MPGWTGHAHDATGFGARSTSTRHIRQFPAIRSFLEALANDLGVKTCGSLMVAVSRDCHPSFLTSLYQRGPSFDRHFLAIDGEFDFRRSHPRRTETSTCCFGCSSYPQGRSSYLAPHFVAAAVNDADASLRCGRSRTEQLEMAGSGLVGIIRDQIGTSPQKPWHFMSFKIPAAIYDISFSSSYSLRAYFIGDRELYCTVFIASISCTKNNFCTVAGAGYVSL